MDWFTLTRALEAEFPNFKIVPKDESRLMAFLAWVMFWNPKFMTQFTVVLGSTVYMPRWMIGTANGTDILRHEAVHMRDFKKYHVFYLLSYILLPIGPSGRAYWEYRGYAESMRAHYERYRDVPDWLIEFYVSQFTSSNYLWMFPFPKTVSRWFWKYRQKLLSQS